MDLVEYGPEWRAKIDEKIERIESLRVREKLLDHFKPNGWREKKDVWAKEKRKVKCCHTWACWISCSIHCGFNSPLSWAECFWACALSRECKADGGRVEAKVFAAFSLAEVVDGELYGNAIFDITRSAFWSFCYALLRTSLTRSLHFALNIHTCPICVQTEVCVHLRLLSSTLKTIWTDRPTKIAQ